MTSELSEPQQALVDQARAHAAILRRGAAQADRTRTFPSSSIDVIKANYGRDLTMVDFALLMRELAKGDASAALGMCMHYFAMGELGRPDVALTTNEHYRGLGKTVGFCAPVSEPGSSNNRAESFVPSDVKAWKDGDGTWTLKGTKHFATFFELSGYAMVFAHWINHSNRNQVVCLVVPTNAPGIETVDDWYTRGMRATRSIQVTFDTRVGEEAYIYDTDKYLYTALVEGGARLFGYMAVYQGIGERMLELAGQSLSRRVPKSFTQPLGYDPVINDGLGRCKALLHTSNLTLLEAMAMFDRHGGTPQVLEHLMMAKLTIGENVTAVASLLQAKMGGHGLLTSQSPKATDGGEFERLGRDVATASVMPPSSDLCRRQLGYSVTGLDPAEAPSLR